MNLEADYPDGVYNVVSLLHIINDTRIWPNFLYSSSSDFYKEEILIGSMAKNTSVNQKIKGIGINERVTVVIYKSKTVLDVLAEIAGLLVLQSILAFFLTPFNEWKFNQKIK